MRQPVPTIVEAVANGIDRVLGGDLVGLYLYGSVVSGGFDPGVSDVDLVAICAPEASAIDLAWLERMHEAIVGREPEWDDRIEVVYVGQATVRAFRQGGPVAVISPGEPLHLMDGAELWLSNWYLVRETGVGLRGPDPKTLIPWIGHDEFIASIADYAAEVRDRSLQDATPGARAYAILTMCRALRTVETGEHGSKQQGAEWTRERLPEWASLIDAALLCRRSRGTVGLTDAGAIEAAEAFMGIAGDMVECGRP